MFDGDKTKNARRYPKYEPLETTAEKVLQNISNRTGLPEIPTKLDFIDKACMGLHPTHLTVIAARPAMGKTTMATQMAFELAVQKIPTTYISLEMTRESIVEKMLSYYSGVLLSDLAKGNVDEVMKYYPAFVETVKGSNLNIIDDFCFTEEEMHRLIEELDHKPKVLFIDHLQQISSGNRRQTMWETLTDYLGYLKQVAMEHNICVVVLSQINRSGEEAPTIANLKGTGAIEEKADQVFLCYRSNSENGRTNYTVDVAKNRFGVPGLFRLHHRLDKARFYNGIEEDESQPESPCRWESERTV